MRKSGGYPADTRTDIDLWAEILSGNNDAWRALVSRYASLIYSVCTHVGLSQADSADCFQQTWLLLFRNRKRIKDASRIPSWLITTAKREALRKHRKAERAVNLGEYPGLIDPNPLPDAKLIQLERQKRLEISLSQLDPDCQRLLEAFFFCDGKKSYEEIARALGYSHNTLGPKRRRCLEKLKKILVHDNYWDERKLTSTYSTKQKKRRKK